MSKRTFEFFSFYDNVGMERRLEQMAEKGWMLEKMGGIFWRWKTADPKRLHFTVTYFPNASEFDPGPTEGQEIFADFCQRSGWTLLLRHGQMQIFYSDRPDALPIETDALVQVETVHKTMKKSVLPTQALMLVLCVWQLVFSYLRFNTDPIEFLASPSSVYMVPAWLLLLGECLCELGFYFHWYRKARHLAEETGAFLRIKTSRVMSLMLLIASALIMLAAILGSAITLGGTLLWLLLMPLIFLAANGMKAWMKHRKFSRRTNRFLTLATTVVLTVSVLMLLGWAIIRFDGFDRKKPVGSYDIHGYEMDIYDDPIPLTVEELTGVTEGLWSKEERVKESLFLTQREYRQDAIPTSDNDVPHISYTVIDVKFPALYDLCLNDLLSENDDWPEEYRDYYQAVDPAPWGATEVYCEYSFDGLPGRRHILCYSDRIVTIWPGWDMSEAQMSKVGNVLG